MGLYNRATGSAGNQAPEHPAIGESKPFKLVELEQAFGGSYRSVDIFRRGVGPRGATWEPIGDRRQRQPTQQEMDIF